MMLVSFINFQILLLDLVFIYVRDFILSSFFTGVKAKECYNEMFKKPTLWTQVIIQWAA